LGQTQQDIGVQQMRNSRLLIVILVDHFARKGLAGHAWEFPGKSGELIEPSVKLCPGALRLRG
jgi:hypothetical protein